MKSIKIGIQSLHADEIASLKELFDHPMVSIYSWHAHDYDEQQLKTCDFLILFARRHWRYLPYKIPYALILADFVSDQKAIKLSQSRTFMVFGFRYSPNLLFQGYLCGSIELMEAVSKHGIPAIFYPKKYPFQKIFNELSNHLIEENPGNIITLINNYKHTASSHKWNKPANSYYVYQYVSTHVTKYHFIRYGAPDHQISFDESIEVQSKARYTIHIKYWGHVCNAVVKSLALGTPVIMDVVTFKKGRYESYVRHGKNGLVFNSKEEIVNYLESDQESVKWRKLKQNCIQEAPRWHFPYTEEEKKGWQHLFRLEEK